MLTVPGGIGFSLSKFDGAPDKLMVSRQFQDGTLKTSYYHWPTLALDHEYPTATARINLEFSGEKYAEMYAPLNGSTKVYNSDHSVWKTIPLPVTGNDAKLTNVNISEGKLNGDALLEVIYSYQYDFFGSMQYYTKVINENGVNYLTVPGAYYLTIIELPELDNKLIGYMRNFDNTTYGSVYSTATLASPAFEIERGTIVSPNPVASVLNIQSRAEIREIALYNATGVLVAHKKEADMSQINVEKLAAGIYFLKLNDANNRTSDHKISIVH